MDVGVWVVICSGFDVGDPRDDEISAGGDGWQIRREYRRGEGGYMDCRVGNLDRFFACILSLQWRCVGILGFPEGLAFEDEGGEWGVTPPVRAETKILSPGFSAVMPFAPLILPATSLNPLRGSWKATCVIGKLK